MAYIIGMGASMRALRVRGIFEYAVVARRIKPTFKQKSTMKERGVYGLKMEKRDCSADQKIRATYGLLEVDTWKRSPGLDLQELQLSHN